MLYNKTNVVHLILVKFSKNDLVFCYEFFKSITLKITIKIFISSAS